MKKILIGLMVAMLSFNVFADAAKGQQYYLKYLRPLFGYNGQEFATQHLKIEWKRYFKKDAKKFIQKYSKKHPEAAEFLASDTFQKIAPHVEDFAVKYAADSGELPSCN
ncbi:hypothetical protein DI392_07755 [Vibrio albus]|uniref:Uncharacterized protein n=1 Tax=Vibrio albus TaxID=2200953 RepID=A0A2U3BBB4_9VIBR|nr:hypothetical protein [Vibrio albus]PWI34080.1 hypothetical protein DI392_07755 [Vibrio albus]